MKVKSISVENCIIINVDFIRVSHYFRMFLEQPEGSIEQLKNIPHSELEMCQNIINKIIEATES